MIVITKGLNFISNFNFIMTNQRFMYKSSFMISNYTLIITKSSLNLPNFLMLASNLINIKIMTNKKLVGLYIFVDL